MQQEFVELTVEGVALRLAVSYRARAGSGTAGGKAPIVFLHGFGGGREDYTGIARRPEFDGRGFLAWDAPGCGASECADLSALTIPFLTATAAALIARYGLARLHLVGHSMGGLTALMLARAAPGGILSFTNIEGNLAPEDCFFSRQVAEFPAARPEDFLEAFTARLARAAMTGAARYTADLRQRVRAGAVAPIFRSIVELSDRAPLLEHFLGLRCEKMFMFGAENRGLSYLGRLEKAGVELAEIPASGHFPMYSNPDRMWQRLAAFLAATEAAASETGECRG